MRYDIVISEGVSCMNMPRNIGELAIWVVVIAAVIALMYVALVQFGIAIPPFVVNIFWILVVAVAVILSIKFVMNVGDKG